ncbi:MAG: MJ0042-type zinc finger domain-containing protein [Anaerolineae bacterium]
MGVAELVVRCSRCKTRFTTPILCSR